VIANDRRELGGAPDKSRGPIAFIEREKADASCLLPSRTSQANEKKKEKGERMVINKMVSTHRSPSFSLVLSFHLHLSVYFWPRASSHGPSSLLSILLMSAATGSRFPPMLCVHARACGSIGPLVPSSAPSWHRMAPREGESSVSGGRQGRLFP